GVDAAGAAVPLRRLFVRQRDDRVVAVELRAVDEVGARARRIEEPRRDLARDRVVVAQDRAQWHDPRSAGNKEERPAERLPPNEVAADPAAQFELVPRDEGL